MSDEPAITINGVALSVGQAMTVRVAVTNFAVDLKGDKDALGTDEHGVLMRTAYLTRLHEIFMLMK